MIARSINSLPASLAENGNVEFTRFDAGDRVARRLHVELALAADISARTWIGSARGRNANHFSAEFGENPLVLREGVRLHCHEFV